MFYFAVEYGNDTLANVTLEDGNLNETIIVGLRKYTNYSIQVLGFTERDKIGPLSSPIYAMTDQDGKNLQELPNSLFKKNTKFDFVK